MDSISCKVNIYHESLYVYCLEGFKKKVFVFILQCPLCMEPLEMDDINFFPCTCGYQVRKFNRFLLLVSITESDDTVVKLFALLNFRASSL